MSAWPAKWLLWSKTRNEVFGGEEHEWYEGWALRYIFGTDVQRYYLFDILLKDKHLQWGQGILPIPGEWKKRRRAKYRARRKTEKTVIASAGVVNCMRGGAVCKKKDRSSGASGVLRLEIDVDAPDVPADIERMRDQLFRRCETSGSGSACAIHAAFGAEINGCVVARRPRDFLRDCFAASASDFIANLDNAYLATRLSDFLWKSVMQPYVCAMEPRLPCNEILGPEERQIARTIARENPVVVVRCREAVMHSRTMLDRFTAKRAELVQAFGATCISPLRDTFVVPLLTALQLLEVYANTAYEPYGTKLDALFGQGPQSRRLQQGVLEYHGIENLNLFHAGLQGILENWEDSIYLALVQNFSEKLEAAIQGIYVDPAEPIANFFAEVYPSYLQVIADTNEHYYLSDVELLALCRTQRRNIALCKYNMDTGCLK